MRWSIEELIFGLKTAGRLSYGFWSRLADIPRAIWRMIEVFFHWLFTGYCWVTIWDLDWYFVDVIIGRLKQFQKLKNISRPMTEDDFSEGEDPSQHAEFICNEQAMESRKIVAKLIADFEIMRDDTIWMGAPESKGEMQKTSINFHGEEHIVNAWVNNATPEERALRDKFWDDQQAHNKKTLELFAEYFDWLND